MNKLKYILTGLIVSGIVFFSASAAASVLQGFQGGTGFGPSTSAGNAGYCLTVASTTPWITYALTPCSSGNPISTSSPITAFNFPYWANTTGGLNGTSTLFYSSSTGYIGIGTTTPAYQFDVAGTGAFSVGIHTPALLNLTSNGFVKTSGGTGALSIDTNTYSTSTPANPTATVGETATNGTLNTFLRSDAAPALSNTGVASGTYTNANITVASSGRIMAASNGSSGSPISTSSPITQYNIPYWGNTTGGLSGSSPSQFTSFACTGGTMTVVGANTVHTFNSSSTLVCTGATTTVQVLIVGGGGGAGQGAPYAGGGGAGGFIATTTKISGNITVTVGSPGGNNANGTTSTFNGISALGGGAGSTTGNGGNGGSGGGAGSSGTGGTGTVGQGNNGGSTNSATAGGGGGGCLTTGTNGVTTAGGNGGNGCASSITGTSVYYAGGGSGQGSVSNGTEGNGQRGFGGGGSGASTPQSGIAGVVIVSYPTAAGIVSDNWLAVNGKFSLRSSSTVITPLIGGSSLGLGSCASATTTIDASYNLETVKFITSPQFDPGAGFFWNSVLTSPGLITTRVCAAATSTPASTKYNVGIIE